MTSNSFDNTDKFEETLLSLNDAQQQAVLSEAQNLQILAGPGSGKTRVLTVRVAYLVVKKDIKPQNIVVVTFTNKAAKEMLDRLKVLIGPTRTSQLLIGTFHSICNRLLRRFGSIVGLKNNFTIIDTDESKTIIDSIKKEFEKNKDLLQWTQKHTTPTIIFGLISKAKSQGLTAKEYADQAIGDDFKSDISMIYTQYEIQLEKDNLVDFDNLLLKTCQLLRIKKNVLANVEAVLVDEYQDTNVVQYDLIKLITSQQNKKTVTIVGDPDQSIFGWRSAEPKNFEKMSEEFESKAVNMEQNYRSSGNILKAALHVILQDKSRINKSLYTNNPDGVPISLINTPDEDTQAEFVAKEIKRVIKYSKGLIQYKDIAVLMRMNFISLKFEQVFRRNKIPFSVIKGDRFFNRVEVKDILCYLRFAYNPSDSVSFKRIINVPKRGLGDINLKKITTYREDKNITFMQALEDISRKNEVPSIVSGVRRKIAEFYEICYEIKKQIEDEEDISNIINWVINSVNYEHHLDETYNKNKKNAQEVQSRMHNLSELISLAKQFNSSEEDNTDSSFYLSEQDSNRQQKNSTSEEDITVLDEADILDLDSEPDDVDDMTTMDEKDFDTPKESQHFVNTQSFSSQNLNQSYTQNVDSQELLEEAFEEDFHVDDAPVYSTKKSPFQDFMEYCSLCSDQKELDDAEVGEGGKVTVATMHASKGLEWSCVFIPTCNDGIIPASKGSLEEERRLLYVGMTRSKFQLYCISPQRRDFFGRSERQFKTPFLDGMKKGLITSTPSQWNNDIRRVLAVTTGQAIVPDDDLLRTTDATYDSNYITPETAQENKAMDIRFGGGSAATLDVMGGFTTASSLYHNSSSTKRTTQAKPNKREKRTKKQAN